MDAPSIHQGKVWGTGRLSCGAALMRSAVFQHASGEQGDNFILRHAQYLFAYLRRVLADEGRRPAMLSGGLRQAEFRTLHRMSTYCRMVEIDKMLPVL